MNKKFNLLALAAAASACGALVLTSCGNNVKTWTVRFETNDLRVENSKGIYEYYTIPNQKVKNGKTATPPNPTLIKQKGAVRFTRNTDGKEILEQELKGWSYDDEGTTNRDEFDFTDPITENTNLYPIYDDDSKATVCLTIELGKGKWALESANTGRVWDDNWFVKGASLTEFGICLENAIIIPPLGMELTGWKHNGKDFKFEGKTIDTGMTITAIYSTKS